MILLIDFYLYFVDSHEEVQQADIFKIMITCFQFYRCIIYSWNDSKEIIFIVYNNNKLQEDLFIAIVIYKHTDLSSVYFFDNHLSLSETIRPSLESIE